MKAQKPAEGILKINDWGHTVTYQIQCDCGDADCSHYVEVEADACNIQVHTYVTHHTKGWESNRWKQIWQILTKGYAEMQSTIVMKNQTVVNYVGVLQSALKDVELLKTKE